LPNLIVLGLRRSRKQVRELKEYQSGKKCVLSSDVVEFCRKLLNYEPYRYMWLFFRDPSHLSALLQARQTGKTFNGMAKLLWYNFN